MSYLIKKSFLSGVIVLFSVFTIPNYVLAQNSSSINIDSPLTVQTLEQFIEIILGAIVQVGGIILVFGIIYCWWWSNFVCVLFIFIYGCMGG